MKSNSRTAARIPGLVARGEYTALLCIASDKSSLDPEVVEALAFEIAEWETMVLTGSRNGRGSLELDAAGILNRDSCFKGGRSRGPEDRMFVVVEALAGRDDLTEAAAADILRLRYAEWLLVDNPRCPAGVLAKVVRGRFSTIYRAYGGGLRDREMIESSFRRLLEHPDLDHAVVAGIAAANDDRMREQTLVHQNCEPGLLNAAIAAVRTSPRDWRGQFLSKNQKCPADLLTVFAGDGELALHVAQNPSSPSEAFERILLSDFVRYGTQEFAVKSPLVDDDLLVRLATTIATSANFRKLDNLVELAARAGKRSDAILSIASETHALAANIDSARRRVEVELGVSGVFYSPYRRRFTFVVQGAVPIGNGRLLQGEVPFEVGFDDFEVELARAAIDVKSVRDACQAIHE